MKATSELCLGKKIKVFQYHMLIMMTLNSLLNFVLLILKFYGHSILLDLYNTWLRKIDELYDTNWCDSDSNVFINKNPNYIYSAFKDSLKMIIENTSTSLK